MIITPDCESCLHFKVCEAVNYISKLPACIPDRYTPPEPIQLKLSVMCAEFIKRPSLNK